LILAHALPALQPAKIVFAHQRCSAGSATERLATFGAMAFEDCGTECRDFKLHAAAQAHAALASELAWLAVYVVIPDSDDRVTM
jgi:hypothetical protein